MTAPLVWILSSKQSAGRSRFPHLFLLAVGCQEAQEAAQQLRERRPRQCRRDRAQRRHSRRDHIGLLVAVDVLQLVAAALASASCNAQVNLLCQNFRVSLSALVTVTPRTAGTATLASLLRGRCPSAHGRRHQHDLNIT